MGAGFTLCTACGSTEFFTGALESADDSHSIGDSENSSNPEPENSSNPEPSSSPSTGPLLPTSASVFFSGHSLINLNTPTFFAQLAQSSGLSVNYQLQMGLGSNIRFRLQCPYNGQQADGENISYRLHDELVRPGVYDHLILAENHNILESITYSATTSMARNVYDLFTTGNPNGQAWLYENWLYRDDPDLAAFLIRIQRERTAWDCVASKVNTLRGSRKPMKVLPASTALAALIRAIQESTVPGITDPTTLFHDNVHLTNLGNYFIALLDYAVVYQRSPVGLPRQLIPMYDPYPSISAETAARLQEIAWQQAQIALNDSTSHLKSDAVCSAELQSVCTQVLGNIWACNPSNPERLVVQWSNLNEPVGVETGAHCWTSPGP